jgi:hypothetical protein
MVCTLLWMKYIIFKWNKIEFGTLENMWRIDTLQMGQRNKIDYFQLATTHNHYHPEAWHLSSLSLYIIQFFKSIDGEIINTHSMLNVTRGVSQGVWPCHFTSKSILRQKNNYGKSNISPRNNIIFKITL